ncbi:MAG TPA: hypothetical protein VEG63_13455 [Candidatus Acidoferrales bacterium]|nr:hypothetical protein [Candidatus Acidoferrales bacterium]
MAAIAGNASPGMEALRPLELGELLDRTFSLYRRYFMTFVLIAAAPYLVSFAAGLLVSSGRSAMAEPGRGPTLSISILLGSLILMVFSLFAAAAAQAASFFAVSEAYLGRPTTFGAAYRQAKGKLTVLVGTAFYVGLAVAGGFILLVIPGLIVLCRSCVAIPSVILEGLGPREGFKRSMELTKGYAWRAAAILGLTFIIAMVAGFIFQYPIQFVAIMLKDTPAAPIWIFVGQVGNLVAQCLAGPIAYIAMTLFYYDLRVRKEGFDLERLLSGIGGQSAIGGMTPGPLGSIR